MNHRAVIFDLGGVVLGSPLHEIARYETEHGVPDGLINRVVMSSGTDGAWARHERGELAFDEFCRVFAAECAVAGGVVDVAEMMRRIEAVTAPRPEMLEAVATLRAAGLRVAALTNNWEPLGDVTFTERFDVVIESSVVGLRKPDPAIYELTLAALETAAVETVFLDDIGANLKPARALGMTTIKVNDPVVALTELGETIGLDLSGAPPS